MRIHTHVEILTRAQHVEELVSLIRIFVRLMDVLRGCLELFVPILKFICIFIIFLIVLLLWLDLIQLRAILPGGTGLLIVVKSI